MASPTTFAQGPIEPIAHDQHALEEDEFETSDFDSETLSSSATSLNTSIYQHAFENGRRVCRKTCKIKYARLKQCSITSTVTEREK
jgi:hypothetical protein